MHARGGEEAVSACSGRRGGQDAADAHDITKNTLEKMVLLSCS